MSKLTAHIALLLVLVTATATPLSESMDSCGSMDEHGVEEGFVNAAIHGVDDLNTVYVESSGWGTLPEENSYVVATSGAGLGF